MRFSDQFNYKLPTFKRQVITSTSFKKSFRKTFKKNCPLLLYGLLFSCVYILGEYVYTCDTFKGFLSEFLTGAVLFKCFLITIAVAVIFRCVLFFLDQINRCAYNGELSNHVPDEQDLTVIPTQNLDVKHAQNFDTKHAQNPDGKILDRHGNFLRRSVAEFQTAFQTLFQTLFSKTKSFCLWKGGLGVWLLLFLSWLPCYISYFPGVYSYDMSTQAHMALGESAMTTHHPPLHTFIIRLCFLTGDLLENSLQNLFPSVQNLSVEIAIIIYSATQMLLLSLMISRLLSAIAERLSGLFLLLSLIFYVFNPVVALFSFSTTKDIYFTIALLGLFTELLEYSCAVTPPVRQTGNRLSGPAKKRTWKLILFSILCSLFRNNFIYAWAIAVVLMGIGLKEKRKFWMVGALSVIIALAIMKFAYPVLGIEKGNSAEKLSVPLQQISYTTRNNTLTLEELTQIQNYLELDIIWDQFNPRFADPTKDRLNNGNYDSNPAAFWKLWMQLGSEFPVDYTTAFLQLNIPYWYQGANPYDPYAQREYVETSLRSEKSGLTREEFLPVTYTFYSQFSIIEDYDSIPFIIRWMFCLATPIWLMLACGAALLYQGNRCYIRCLIPLLLFWMTYLLGPVSNARYIFPFMVLYPILISLPFTASEPPASVPHSNSQTGNLT